MQLGDTVNFYLLLYLQKELTREINVQSSEANTHFVCMSMNVSNGMREECDILGSFLNRMQNDKTILQFK